jgi:hypothetical protein
MSPTAEFPPPDHCLTLGPQVLSSRSTAARLSLNPHHPRHLLHSTPPSASGSHTYSAAYGFQCLNGALTSSNSYCTVSTCLSICCCCPGIPNGCFPRSELTTLAQVFPNHPPRSLVIDTHQDVVVLDSVCRIDRNQRVPRQ